MRNQEAARYARWSAGIALAICLLVLGVYVQHRAHDRAHENKLPAVPATVAQQSANFSISRVIGTRTLFTVRASQATQFKDENRSLLENVTITIYGPRGNRDDLVRANKCSYEPNTGNIRCEGVVQIDLRDAKSTVQQAELHLETSDILFEHDRVSTDKSVALRFPNGEGKGTGLVYDTQSEDVKLEKDVHLDVLPPHKVHAVPVSVTSSSLEFLRGQNVLRLPGPVRAQQQNQILTAGALELQLNAAMQPLRAVATENPEVSMRGARGTASFAANQISTELSADGTIQAITADQNVRGESHGRDGDNHFVAQHTELQMKQTHERSEPQTLLARGAVNIAMDRGEVRKNIATESLRVEFEEAGPGRASIANAETLAPGKLTMTEAGESDQLVGGKLSALFGAQNELKELRGSSGVRITRKRGMEAPQISSAQNLLAKFDSAGNWDSIEESGNTQFRQGDRSGWADSAQLLRATNQLTLNGSASIERQGSHLRAQTIWLNQTNGEVRASGSVTGSFEEQKSNATENSTVDSAQISADEMNGIMATKSTHSPGHAVFSGHARLWQGPDVLQAQTIELWQSEQRAEAHGNVLGAFVEAPHGGGFSPSKQAGKKEGPVLWQVRAPKVDYWSDDGKMEWSGGVDARSSEGVMTGETLEAWFSKDKSHQQTLERALVSGHVRVEQNGRIGKAENGEYLVRYGKFILSGGQPTLADASGNTTTGHNLTFFLANDTILVDSKINRSSEK